MIIVLLGASGSGKSTIENELATHHGFEKIIPYTTRPKRDEEINGKDYYFIDYNKFNKMLKNGCFMEYDEYSQKRLYGTLKSDYAGNKVVVLTPNGFRKLKQSHQNDNNIFAVFINANLGTRIKRYIDRCGTDKFTFDDKNEIAARVERDFGMFLGVEKEVDLVIDNNEESEIKDIINKILQGNKCDDN